MTHLDLSYCRLHTSKVHTSLSNALKNNHTLLGIHMHGKLSLKIISKKKQKEEKKKKKEEKKEKRPKRAGKKKTAAVAFHLSCWNSERQ